MKQQANIKRKACAIVDGALQACTVLDGALQDSDARSGLVQIQSFDSVSKRVLTSAVTIRSSDWPKAGWNIRYCPFCGSDIRTGLNDEMAEVG